ncbi:ATP synthase subunit I [Desulfonatronovibrio hydrogenovorans]|uniref:ATP synthase subunit I n=1 Tax=Desulfonatronovibrio hydrogenovorans TaxID=53245 RepID=UPI0005502386|nr:ATP synthase subunit I [Desulfonatronovibrio hydrogenovorans]
MNKRVEAFLYRRGLVLPQVRLLVRNQIYLSVLGSIFFLVIFSGPVLTGFLTGAILGTLNFYFLAKLIQELVHIKKGAVTPLLFSFYIRLGLIGLVLYFAIVHWGASIYSLLIGLSIVLLNVFIFGVTLVGQKLKEA